MSGVETTVGPALYGSDAPRAAQVEALASGEVPVAVYGLGKMGLPIAAVFAELTGNVVGVDVDPAVVDAVRVGRSHVSGEPGLDELVGEVVAAGALEATTDGAAAASRTRLAVVVVPTLLRNGAPDLSAVEAVAADIAAGLAPGDAVFVESTLPPGACADRLVPLLAESGVDRDAFGLAACPERTASGRALQDVRGAYPKVVGGVDEESTRVAELVYGKLVDNDIVTVSDARTAECVKVLEGVYRDVNIGLANELARNAVELGVDVTEAIEAANTQPFCDLHDPGVGVGGHCIPYYPQFLRARLDGETPVIRAGRRSNERMPRYTAEHVLDGLRAEGVSPADAVALVLGLTYRAGVDEVRATPALPVVEALLDAAVDVDAVDPVTTTTEPFETAGATIVPLEAVVARSAAGPAPGDDATRSPGGCGPPADPADGSRDRSIGSRRDDGYDAVVLVTPQPAFESIDVPALQGGRDGRLVLVDGRQEYTHLRDHDSIHYRGIGIDG